MRTLNSIYLQYCNNKWTIIKIMEYGSLKLNTSQSSITYVSNKHDIILQHGNMNKKIR
jgi:hypothetical protein